MIQARTTIRTRRARSVALAAALLGGALAADLLTQSAAAAAQVTPATEVAQHQVAVTSVSMTSARDGWVLGAVACPEGTCSELARTTTGGAHWTGRVAPAAPLAPSGGQGVDEVHFADDRDGWAFAPQFHVTHDGASSWHRLAVPGGGSQVLDVASGGGVAYAVVSSCVVGDPSRCPTPASVWTADVRNDHWVRTAVRLPSHGTPSLSVSGSTAYVVLSDPGSGADVFEASTDRGAHWRARGTPCATAAGEVLHVAATSATDAVLLCSTDVQPGLYTKHVFTSTDTARSDVRRGDAPMPDVPLDLAASGKVVAIAAAGGSSAIQRSGDEGSTWTTPYAYDPADMADLAVVGGTGVVVRGPAALSGGAGQLLASKDSGRHWAFDPVRITR